MTPWSKRRIGLVPKLLSVTAVVVLGIVIVMTQRAVSQLERTQLRAFESKGEAIALSLAAATEQSAGSDLSIVQGAIDSNKVIIGVRYVYIEDAQHRVTVHTFSPTFPAGLEKLNTIELGEQLRGRVKVRHIERDFSALGFGLNAIDVAAPAAGGALGTVHVGMDLSVIQADVAALRRSMLGWGGVVAVIGIVFGLLVTALTVIRPISALTRVTADIVARGDLTQQITVSSRDEIGDLAKTFALMVEKLKEIPRSLRTTTELLGTTVTSISATSEEGSQIVSRQAAALQEAQVTVQEIRQTSLMAAQKAEAVLKVAERADAVSRSGELAIEQTLGGLAETRDQVATIADRISELTERTRQIGLITETVKDLADQSNMLALNAAIEAVRSGEHGKGFGVVAREIRSLADQSIQATNRVRQILDDIMSAIRTAVMITEKGTQRMENSLVQARASGENLRELSGIVKENSSAVRQIAAAVSQQNAGITQIFSAVNDLNKMMDETVRQLEATSKSVNMLKDASQNVTAIVRSFHY